MFDYVECFFNLFTSDNAESKISKVLLNSFPMNGHTSGFGPWNQKLEDFASPRV